MRIKQVAARSFTDEELEVYQSRLDSISPPGVKVDIVDIKGPPSPPDFKTPRWVGPCYDLRCVAFDAPLMIARAEEAEREGYDAVIFYCAWDPAIFSAKAAVKIPLISTSETMYSIASLLAYRWGLITGIPPMKAMLKKQTQAYGVADHVVSIKTLDFDPYLTFATKKAEVEARFIELGKEQISEGAELIICSCGPLFQALGMEALKRAREKLEVPVIEPQESLLNMAQALVNMGLAQSKVAYPIADAWYKLHK